MPRSIGGVKVCRLGAAVWNRFLMRNSTSARKIVESPKTASTDVGFAGTRTLRRYLYFTAACTGAAIMIVEILGAKMLSPFMGASHFVWTAQIAVTLVALAFPVLL